LLSVTARIEENIHGGNLPMNVTAFPVYRPPPKLDDERIIWE
jgi:hypothetical protein